MLNRRMIARLTQYPPRTIRGDTSTKNWWINLGTTQPSVESDNDSVSGQLVLIPVVNDWWAWGWYAGTPQYDIDN